MRMTASSMVMATRVVPMMMYSNSSTALESTMLDHTSATSSFRPPPSHTHNQGEVQDEQQGRQQQQNDGIVTIDIDIDYVLGVIQDAIDIIDGSKDLFLPVSSSDKEAHYQKIMYRR